VIDRASARSWQEEGGLDTFERAQKRTKELLAAYSKPQIPAEQLGEMRTMVERLALEAGMDYLPETD